MTAGVTEAVRQQLISELKRLRKGTGLTLGNLRERPWLIAAINPGTDEKVLEILVYRINDLKTSRENIALANAVNLPIRTRLPQGDNLELRRSTLLASPTYKSMFGSERTLVRVEDQAFEQFADLVISHRLLADGVSAPPPTRGSASPRAVLTDLLNDLSQLQQKIAKALVDLE